MNQELTFKNLQGRKIIKISNFKFNFTEYMEYIDFDINIEFDSLKLNLEIQSEIGDFAYLSLGLQKIFKNEITKAYFEPIDHAIRMNFSVNINGDLILYFKYYYPNFNAKISFEITVDKNEIPEIVENIQSIIKSK